MDFVLKTCDHYLLDKVWARIIPAVAFPETLRAIQSSTANSSSHVLPIIAGASKWNQLVSYLPHPPITLPDDVPLEVYSSAISAWPRDYIPRQLASLTVLTFLGIHLLYFLVAWFSYTFIFNHEMMKHPRFLENQVRLEIITSLKAFPGMIMLTVPWFQVEVMGYSKLYDGLDTYGWTYLILSVPFFLFFTDYCIYWIHRWLHLPSVYKFIHKPHHKWIIPTPFSSHAFHPVDGFAQSLPYHIFIFLFPLHRITYLGLFVFVNIWSILIHDSDMITGHPLETIINGPAHHTLHHLYFTCNYGQYFTWADRVGGSYRQPKSELDPLLEVQMQEKAKSLKSE